MACEMCTGTGAHRAAEVVDGSFARRPYPQDAIAELDEARRPLDRDALRGQGRR